MGAIISFQNAHLSPKAFTVGAYLWLGSKDKTKGYPIRITTVNTEKNSFTYVGMDTSEPHELPCSMTSRNIHPIQPQELSAYVEFQLSLLEPQRTYWQVVKDCLRHFRKQLLIQHEERQAYHAYKSRIKHLNIL